MVIVDCAIGVNQVFRCCVLFIVGVILVSHEFQVWSRNGVSRIRCFNLMLAVFVPIVHTCRTLNSFVGMMELDSQWILNCVCRLCDW